MLNWILFSMVGLGFHSVVFGLTYGAHASAFVPVIKVPAIFFISYKESFLRLATDRILIQSILTSIAPAICRWYLKRWPSLWGSSPFSWLLDPWSDPWRSVINITWEPYIMTWFSSSQGGWDIRHLRHLQPGLHWRRHTWGPWSPYSCFHYLCPASQKNLNI